MAGKGGPKGNTFAKKGHPWSRAIARALEQYENPEVRSGDALRRIADRIIEKALEGDIKAMEVIGDRIEGKVAQRLEHMGEDGGPVEFKWRGK